MWVIKLLCRTRRTTTSSAPRTKHRSPPGRRDAHTSALNRCSLCELPQLFYELEDVVHNGRIIQELLELVERVGGGIFASATPRVSGLTAPQGPVPNDGESAAQRDRGRDLR